MAKSKNISELLELHDDLEAMFVEHQRALLHFELENALELLDRYERCLFLHMRDEEEVLIPLYERRAAMKRGGDAKLLRDEHDKMRGLLQAFRSQIEGGKEVDDLDLWLLKLLDREAFFKRLCTHHDMREEQHFYRAIDDELSIAEKAELLGRVTCGFAIGAAYSENTI